ncbi:Metallo-dependent phosphatase-like protein [Phakopsora pachyrhizi]|nr:Metallo-dependent phosphatase-like protein [Phakopsora pachyrhizi]
MARSVLKFKDYLQLAIVLLTIYQSILCVGSNVRNHIHRRHQPSASDPKASPTRPLEWGDLNIIHTTDSHGWLIGHLKDEEPEPSYSADFGDFHSFVMRMKEKARRKNVDLLVIDTGDLHDGNGLSDAEPLIHPGTPRGRSCNNFFTRVPYDILTIGNHELYQTDIAQDMHNSAPNWNGSYLTSNVNITTSGKSVPIGSRYRKFTTAQGRRITAFGIIFHFTSNANGTIVQPPSELVKESWFQEAIIDQPDVFLLTGHMGISDPDWQIVFDSIRGLHPKVPIIILGGHLHIRDCRQLDNRSMSLASGRYMETVGWMSLSGLGSLNSEVNFTRRYLDNNRATYAFHAGNAFDTPEGVKMTKDISDKAVEFNLTYRFGVAPQSYFVNRVPSTEPNSLVSLLTGPEGVMRTVITNKERTTPPYFVVNTGANRFDIFAGDFTMNDQFITMPFENKFVYVADVPRKTAEEILFAINAGDIALSRRQNFSESFLKGDVNKDEHYHSGGDVEEFYKSWLRFQRETHLMEKIRLQTDFSKRGSQPYLSINEKVTGDNDENREDNLISFGYVTKDQCSGKGDDTIHEALPVHEPESYVASALPQNTSTVDLVFYKFIQKFVLVALNKIEPKGKGERRYTEEDVKEYSNIKSNEMIGIYATLKWS